MRLHPAINTVYTNPFPGGHVGSGGFGQRFYNEFGIRARINVVIDPQHVFN